MGVVTVQNTESQVPKGYKKTDVGVIPVDWEVKELSSIGRVVSGKRLPKGWLVQDMENPHPYLRVTDMFMGGVDLSDIKYVPEEIVDQIKQYRIFIGDIFISVAGTLGVVGKIPSILDGANLTENANRITDIQCDQNYLLQVMMSELIQKTIEGIQTIGAQPKLALTRLRQFLIPIPPTLEEQQAIAQVLTNMDDYIHSLQQLVEKKKNIKQGTMQQLLTGRTRLPGFGGTDVGTKKTDVGVIPVDWEVFLLDQLAQAIDPHPSHRAPPEVSNGIPFLGIGDLDTNGNICNANPRLVDEKVFIEHQQRYNLKDNLIGLGRVASIGKVVLIRDDLGMFTISPTFGILKSKNIYFKYLFYQLQSQATDKYFSKIMSGSTRSSVGMIVLRQLPIAIPPTLEEQQAIAQVLTNMDDEITALQEKIEKAKQVKQGAMQELLTGKRRLV